ncbi:hypothetical protein L208DRAFT_1400023 [Tricholoma matsutake]|nr:hypothetical protein L208DRAFT_1400023 [Tricholoma matsutake 945]
MRFHTRPPKKCSAWTSDDLHTHNIKVVDTDVATFFGINELPRPAISEAILATVLPSPSENPADALSSLDKDDRLFLTHLHEAIRPHHVVRNDDTNSSPVMNFAYHLLNMLGFTGDKGDRIVRRHQDMPLFMCGQYTHAVADVCVFHPNSETVLLLVKEDSLPDGPQSHGRSSGEEESTRGDPEAQLLAQAIAVFQMHNRALRLMRLPPVETKIVPAIVMRGTTPVLYKFEITAGLVEAVQTSRYPPKVTRVQRMTPPVARTESLREEGMGAVDNRVVFLGCLDAFKEVVWMESSFSPRL